MNAIAIPSSIAKVFSMKALPLARNMPLEVGIIHLVGIGGIGISGIAEILHNLGYKVQGSDIAESYNTERLKKQGIKIMIGHEAAHVENAAVVVISSAVKADNPEVLAARAARIPVVRRAEMLAELMRLKMAVAVAGTHGKTTTTSLMACLFDAANLQPTVINGGIINAYGTNAKVGSGEWMVVEADESDGTFIKLPSTVAVITNIDPEHLDFYGSFEKVREAFETFVQNIPFYGFGVLCIDHPEVQSLIARTHDRRIITYGLSPQADVRAINIVPAKGGQRFDVVVSEPGNGVLRTIENIELPIFGEHNVRNALAVAAVGIELKMTDETLRKAFASFTGVKRRFTQTGEWNGVRIIDDYGHHPVEIAATLKAARAAVAHTPEARVIAVVQPHRYTRLRDLFDQFCTCFNDADVVIVSDVYSAGEEPIEGISRDALVKGLSNSGHRHPLGLNDTKDLAPLVAKHAQPGDIVVCLGAGSITKWAYALPEELKKV